jgi:hypothetical protein
VRYSALCFFLHQQRFSGLATQEPMGMADAEHKLKVLFADGGY